MKGIHDLLLLVTDCSYHVKVARNSTFKIKIVKEIPKKKSIFFSGKGKGTLKE